MTERVVELEIKVAYLEDTLDQLDKVIIAQQQKMDKLERTCHYLLAQYEKVSDKLDINQTIEKPPHY